jgi:hypothetical protein
MLDEESDASQQDDTPNSTDIDLSMDDLMSDAEYATLQAEVVAFEDQVTTFLQHHQW